MKRLLVILLVCTMLLSTAYAADIDLSGMTFDELVALREQIDLALWNCSEWQQVEVPVGTYVIGKDIPAGHWTIKPLKGSICLVTYFKEADFSGMMPLDTLYDCFYQGIGDPEHELASIYNMTQIDLELQEGWHISLSDGAIFEPFTGKPDLGFK